MFNMKAGYILIEHETDEFLGRVQWRDENGNMTDDIKTVHKWPNHGYVFCNAGLGVLEIIK